MIPETSFPSNFLPNYAKLIIPSTGSFFHSNLTKQILPNFFLIGKGIQLKVNWTELTEIDGNLMYLIQKKKL